MLATLSVKPGAGRAPFVANGDIPMPATHQFSRQATVRQRVEQNKLNLDDGSDDVSFSLFMPPIHS
jgi:hypothetical protein